MVSPRPHGLTGHSLKWFQRRCLTLALERLLARHPKGILVNPVWYGEIGPDLFARGKFLNASARRSNCFPFRPNGVTIRSQGTKAPVETLEARDRRSSLTARRMSRIAESSYCGPTVLTKIKSGGVLPFKIASGARKREVADAGAFFIFERGFIMRNRLDINSKHSQGDRSRDGGGDYRGLAKRAGTAGEP